MYTRESQQSHSENATDRANERVGFLVHEMRNLVNTAVVAFEVLKSGNVGVVGSTGAVRSNAHGIARSHHPVARGRSFEKCCQEQETDPRFRIHRRDWGAAALEADARGLKLIVSPVQEELAIEADKQILSAVVGNLYRTDSSSPDLIVR